MDLKQLLGKLTIIEGSMKAAEKHPIGPKFTGQWKGTDKGTPGKKLVGDSIEPEESILKDLSKGPTPKTKEKELAEQFEAFLQALEEENLGVNDKRPARHGARPARDYGKTGEPSKRYKQVEEAEKEFKYKVVCDGYDKGSFVDKNDAIASGQYMIYHGEKDYKKIEVKDLDSHKVIWQWKGKKTSGYEMEESRGHKVVATKLANMERMKNVQIPTPAERRAELEKQKSKKQVKEYGADNVSPYGQPAIQDPKQAAQVAQATQTLKAATGATAPTTNIAKAISAASQGKPVGQQDMKALEPMMKDVATIAQDPKLATQFKTLAQQINQTQLKQAKI